MPTIEDVFVENEIVFVPSRPAQCLSLAASWLANANGGQLSAWLHQCVKPCAK